MRTRSPSMDTRELSRAWFFQTLLSHVAPLSEAILGGDAASGYARRIAGMIAEAVARQFPAMAERAAPWTAAEFAAFLTIFREQLGGVYVVESVHDDEIVLKADRCPWQEGASHLPALCALLVAVYGWLAARWCGAARIVHAECVDAIGQCCRVHIHLLETAADPALAGELFTREDATSPVSDSACEAMVQRSRQGAAPLAAPDELLRCHLAAVERLERALEAERAARKRMMDATRVKEEFLAAISHEFRTPITTMQGYLGLLEEGVLGALTPEQRQALETTRRNLNRLHQMVGDLLDHVAITRGEARFLSEPVEMAEVLETSLRRTETMARERGIELQAEFASPVGQVHGDREKLVQVVTHLLDNAVKFSAPRQAVCLRARGEEHEVVVEVRDAGIGMTPEQLRHVFTPFTQGESGLNRRYGGLGMGLALIRNLVHMHGGDIRIDSQPGAGTSVAVRLPAASTPAGSTATSVE